MWRYDAYFIVKYVVMTSRGDRGKLFILFVPLFLTFSITQQDCVLPVIISVRGSQDLRQGTIRTDLFPPC